MKSDSRRWRRTPAQESPAGEKVIIFGAGNGAVARKAYNTAQKRTRAKVNEKRLREVAELYRDNVNDGVWRAIADRFGVSPSTAGRMCVSRARPVTYPPPIPERRRHSGMTRNANGESSIYQWKRNGNLDGSKGAISYKDENGETKRYVAYGCTRQQVRAKLDKARERLTAGAPVKAASRTVGDWLAHWRVTTLAVSDRKESTRALYATLCRKHLEPALFGGITLDKLRPSNIEALVLAMRQEAVRFDDPTDVHHPASRTRRRCARWTHRAQSRRPSQAPRRRTPRSKALGRQRCRRGPQGR